jgi:hypothetical protein
MKNLKLTGKGKYVVKFRNCNTVIVMGKSFHLQYNTKNQKHEKVTTSIEIHKFIYYVKMWKWRTYLNIILMLIITNYYYQYWPYSLDRKYPPKGFMC